MVPLWPDGACFPCKDQCPDSGIPPGIEATTFLYMCVRACVCVCTSMHVLVHADMPAPSQVTGIFISFRTRPCVKEGHTSDSGFHGEVCVHIGGQLMVITAEQLFMCLDVLSTKMESSSLLFVAVSV